MSASGVGRFEHVLGWWRQREPRERVMVSVMVVAIAAFVAWYGAVAPLKRARDAAKAEHAAAAADWTRVQSELAHLIDLQGRMPAPPTDAASMRKAVMQAATLAELAISRERIADTQGFEVESDAATPQQLFIWLDALRLRHGVAPSTLSVAKAAGRLRVQATFAPFQTPEPR